MRRALGLFAAAMMIGQASWAADVFVRDAEGSGLSQDQMNEVTQSVKNAINNMPEHSLVNSSDQADFVLQPSVVTRGSQQVLRIEKLKDNQVIGMSEEPISSTSDWRQSSSVAETAMQEDRYAASDREVASVDQGTQSGSTQAGDMGAGTTTGMAGSVVPQRGLGYFTAGLGPAFAVGLESDSVMYSVLAAYNIEFTESITGKALANLNFGSGTDSSRFTTVGIGANFYPMQERVAGGRPYIEGELSYGSVRDDNDNTEEGLAVGAGAGFQFATQSLSYDVNLHYTLLTAEISDDIPSILGVRLAVNF